MPHIPLGQATKFRPVRYFISINGFFRGRGLANFWARKSTAILEREAARGDEGSELHVPKRALSALNLVGLGIGGTIGAGIFVLTGHAAAANAGPAVTLSFTLGAVACAFAGLCYAELSSTIPISGSAYTYAYATMGELIAWIIGWDLILEYAWRPLRLPSAGPAMSSTSLTISASIFRQSSLRRLMCSMPRITLGRGAEQFSISRR